ncbi:hypothetical protein F2P81_008220 [Scophthalmus maximus]|uniref:Uncharacterized protein n=1 Tax=Scophthalmus maximus TaxID=52904 RepID=A0A6A4T4C9_SCOMX|nr:hypothetical protein F2P81_008220 [Scophthalmus maximus]
MFVFVGYLQAYPLTTADRGNNPKLPCVAFQRDDLDFKKELDGVSCAQNVTFLSPTNVLNVSLAEALKTFIEELERANIHCNGTLKMNQSLDALEELYHQTQHTMECIDTALDCVMRELNGTVTEECHDPYGRIYPAVEFLEVTIQYREEGHIIADKNGREVTSEDLDPVMIYENPVNISQPPAQHHSKGIYNKTFTKRRREGNRKESSLRAAPYTTWFCSIEQNTTLSG